MKLKKIFLIYIFIISYPSFAQLPSIKVNRNTYNLLLPIDLKDFKLYLKIENVKGFTKVILFKCENENFENIEEKSILEIDTVQPWLNSNEKGKLAQSFENVFLSGESNSLNPQFQYHLHQSPDKKHYLIYHYNFNLAVLKTSLIVLDNKLNLESKSTITIDNEVVNYGFYITNLREVFNINTLDNKGIYIQKLNRSGVQDTFLSIEESNLNRREVKVCQVNDDIYLGNLCEDKAGKLIGIMYSKFNFKVNKIEKVIYHPFNEDIISKLVQNPSEGYYYIQNFEIVERGDAKFILQKKNIISPSFNLNPYQTEKEQMWKPRKQRKLELEKVSVEIYKEGKLVREEFIK